MKLEGKEETNGFPILCKNLKGRTELSSDQLVERKLREEVQKLKNKYTLRDCNIIILGLSTFNITLITEVKIYLSELNTGKFCVKH